MIFDLHPKEKMEELIGREKEVEFAISQLLSGNWVLIAGQREIGKTSLMKVVLNEMKKRHGIKGIYLNLRGVQSLNSLLSLLVSEINKERINFKIKVSVNFIFTSAGIEIKKGSKVVNSLIELLNSIDETVIAFDEVQEISNVSKQFLDVLGNVYATNRNVHIMFSGSYVGLVQTLLNPPSSSPIHGRPPVEIRLKPFDRDTSIYFLKRGMEETKVSFDKYEEVVNKLDGIVGWLTLFGNFYAIRKMRYEEALNQTIEEGKKIMIDELDHFLSDKKNRELYLTIMEVLKFANRWKEIKTGVEVKLGEKIEDKSLSIALKNLVNYNFVTKVNEEYKISDPILREVDFSSLR